MNKGSQRGFTLIEMSIVLVIIGLVVGGILVGRDLIEAAGVRATIAQVEKYNTAANAFYGKYGYLPGDIKDPDASRFGFTARGLYAGEGDGNGVLEGISSNSANENYGIDDGAGETAMFWVDLTSANGLNLNMIEGSFSTALPDTTPPANITGAAIAQYLPTGKLGSGNYFYVFSKSGPTFSVGAQNWYGLSAVTKIVGGANGGVQSSSLGLTVLQAYTIDNKIDDGRPTTGRVRAFYVDSVAGGAGGLAWAPSAASASSSTCYDTTSNQYSVTQNGGAGVNCALSFRLQAGD